MKSVSNLQNARAIMSLPVAEDKLPQALDDWRSPSMRNHSTTEYREINLTKGGVALVDANNFNSLSKHSWYLTSHGYAARKTWKKEAGRSSKLIYMHREIVFVTQEQEIDHINGNKLDNRRKNLRLCTSSQNRVNCGLRVTNKTGYKGVVYHKTHKVFVANIWVDYKQLYVGCSKDPENAARKYDAAARKYYGEFAVTNKDMGLL